MSQVNYITFFAFCKHIFIKSNVINTFIVYLVQTNIFIGAKINIVKLKKV